jgi:hypothetical protein
MKKNLFKTHKPLNFVNGAFCLLLLLVKKQNVPHCDGTNVMLQMHYECLKTNLTRTGSEYFGKWWGGGWRGGWNILLIYIFLGQNGLKLNFGNTWTVKTWRPRAISVLPLFFWLDVSRYYPFKVFDPQFNILFSFNIYILFLPLLLVNIHGHKTFRRLGWIF